MARPSALRLGGLGLALLLGAWLILPRLLRGSLSDEELVQQAIMAVAEGAGQADIVATLEPVSRAYVDGQGADFAMLRGLLWREFKSRGPITSVLGEIQVQLQGDQAQASFNALLADGLDPGSLDLRPDQADAWHFTVQLRREEGQWLITSHERRAVMPQDVFD